MASCARSGCSNPSSADSVYCGLECVDAAKQDEQISATCAQMGCGNLAKVTSEYCQDCEEKEQSRLTQAAWLACYPDSKSKRAPGDQREQLRQELISSSIAVLPRSEAQIASVNALLQWELQRKTLMDSTSLQQVSSDPRLVVWQGDITTLCIEGIVNAANESGLGCFQPMHRCIDNVIHCAAGPSLRSACYQEMQRLEMNGKLPTGEAIVTPAFNLPSKYVIHVPGPDITIGDNPDLLSKAYCSVLGGCKSNQIRSVAFCCISTGIFGYPADDAAEVAVTTVRKWLDDDAVDGSPSIDFVVFNTFLDSDLRIYNTLLSA